MLHLSREPCALKGYSHRDPLVSELLPSPRTPPESRDLALHSPYLSFCMLHCPLPFSSFGLALTSFIPFSFMSRSPKNAPQACKLLFPQGKASGNHTNTRMIRRSFRGTGRPRCDNGAHSLSMSGPEMELPTWLWRNSFTFQNSSWWSFLRMIWPHLSRNSAFRAFEIFGYVSPSFFTFPRKEKALGCLVAS